MSDAQAAASAASERRVVVTGMGAVTPLGLSVEAFWQAHAARRERRPPIRGFDASDLSTRFACELHGFDPLAVLRPQEGPPPRSVLPLRRRRGGRGGPRRRAADGGALRRERDRTGIVFGSGIGGFQTMRDAGPGDADQGRAPPLAVLHPDDASPTWRPGILSIRYGFRGPNHCVGVGLRHGNHNLADALGAHPRGQADVMLTGGSEAVVSDLGIGGFAAMKALSTRNDEPDARQPPVRPRPRRLRARRGRRHAGPRVARARDGARRPHLRRGARRTALIGRRLPHHRAAPGGRRRAPAPCSARSTTRPARRTTSATSTCTARRRRSATWPRPRRSRRSSARTPTAHDHLAPRA